MATKVRLTAKRVADFTCRDGLQQDFLYDAEVPGLAVRATVGSTTKSFVFRYAWGAERPRLTIGDVRAWDVESDSADRPGARQEARRLQTLVDQGIDPRQAKADRIAAVEAKRKEAEAALVRERAAQTPAREAWTEYVAARTPKWGELSLRDHQRVVAEGGKPVTRGRRKNQKVTQQGSLRDLLAHPLGEITTNRIREWARSEALRRPTQARLSLRLLGGFLAWCADQQHLRDSTVPGVDVARVIRDELPKRGVKTDCLQREQLRSWFSAVRQLPNLTMSGYLQGLLLTGARPDEWARLQWSDVDFRWSSLTLRDKVEGTRVIPLTPYVAAILRDLQSRNVRPLKLKPDVEWKPSPWVFASARAASGRIADHRQSHERALAVASIEKLTAHGLRRSFSTLTEWCEVPVGIVAQIQGHKPSATAEKHYKQRPLDLLRLWHVRIEAWMLAEAGIEQPNQDTEKPASAAVALAAVA